MSGSTLTTTSPAVLRRTMVIVLASLAAIALVLALPRTMSARSAATTPVQLTAAGSVTGPAMVGSRTGADAQRHAYGTRDLDAAARVAVVAPVGPGALRAAADARQQFFRASDGA